MKYFLLVLLDVALGYFANQCYKHAPSSIQDGYKVDSESFSTTRALGPMDCARKCKRHSLCQVANLNKRNMDCSLLARIGQIIPDMDLMVIQARELNDNILGLCQDHQCPNNTICTEAENNPAGYHCEPIGCNGYPNSQHINSSSFNRKDLWQFGEIVDYACLRGYFTVTNASCTQDGSWSDFTCEQYNTCFHVKRCTAEWKDYWLYVKKLNSHQKVFCRLGSFISLMKYNMASTPAFTRNSNSCVLIPDLNPWVSDMGYTYFEKYRTDYSVSKFSQNSQYSNSTYFRQSYGRAGDCYTGNDSNVCGVIGHFIINLKGTGFKINSSVQWTTWGTDGVIHNITWSDDNQVVEGFCGGNCGGCEPDGEVVLDAYPPDRPPLESAEVPICKFPF